MTHYDQLRADVADGFGRIVAIYGLNPLYGRIYGTLYLTTEPVSLGELARLVGTAKSTASVALRQMEAFELVRRRRKLRDRKDYYVAQTDVRAIVTSFLRNFVRREAEEGWKLARLVAEEIAAIERDGWPGDVDAELIRERVALLVRSAEVGQLVLDRAQSLLRARRAPLRLVDWIRALGSDAGGRGAEDIGG